MVDALFRPIKSPIPAKCKVARPTPTNSVHTIRTRIRLSRQLDRLSALKRPHAEINAMRPREPQWHYFAFDADFTWWIEPGEVVFPQAVEAELCID